MTDMDGSGTSARTWSDSDRSFIRALLNLLDLATHAQGEPTCGQIAATVMTSLALWVRECGCVGCDRWLELSSDAWGQTLNKLDS